MKRHVAIGAGLFVAAISIAPAWAANGEKRFDSQESAFLRDAAQSDVFEERLGQYAADHAAMDEVKQLGRQMAADHEADLKNIEQLASEHGLDLTKHDTDLSPQQKATYDKLTSLHGVAFDKEYTKLELSVHNRQISQYMRERDLAADQAVKDYADKALPTLQEHKKMAVEAQKHAWT